jgi:hypothetical protein
LSDARRPDAHQDEDRGLMAGGARGHELKMKR